MIRNQRLVGETLDVLGPLGNGYELDMPLKKSACCWWWYWNRSTTYIDSGS